MTLVAAYERLIGARGKELDKELDDEPAATPGVATVPTLVTPNATIEQRASARPKSAKSKKAKRHKTKKPSKKRHRRHR
jgi:hypothetical protein